QVFVGGRRGHHQHEQQVDRSAIHRVKVDGGFQAQHGTDRCVAVGQTAVGNGDAVAESGGAQTLAGNQGFEQFSGVQAGLLSGNQVGDEFQYALLAADRDVHLGTPGGQDAFESDHGMGSADGCALFAVPAFFLGLDQLAVELVHQQIDGGVHVLVLRAGNHLATGNMQGSVDFLLQLFNLHDHLDIGDTVEVPLQSSKLVLDVAAHGFSHIQLVTTDVDLHTLFSFLPLRAPRPLR